MEDDIMKKRFALLRRKLKSVREEKLPGRAVIFSVAAGLLIAAFFTGMIYTKQELYAQEETQKKRKVFFLFSCVKQHYFISQEI